MSDFTDFFPTSAATSGGGGSSIANGVPTQILLVGGGGTGDGAGGGAGGFLDFLPTLLSGNAYTISIGTSQVNTYIRGGGLVNTIVAYAGGRGGDQNQSGGSGGSGGGAGSSTGVTALPGGIANIGEGYYTQGNAGSNGGASFNVLYGAGGGAGKPGVSFTTGGDGLRSNIITATNATTAAVGQVLNTDEVWFAGGGGGSSSVYAGTGVGGKGGGGGEASRTAIPNTGSGGGGSDLRSTVAGATGVTIIRMATSSFTGTTFETEAGSSITPGVGQPVHTLTQGDDTVIVFRSGITIMNLA